MNYGCRPKWCRKRRRYVLGRPYGTGWLRWKLLPWLAYWHERGGKP